MIKLHKNIVKWNCTFILRNDVDNKLTIQKLLLRWSFKSKRNTTKLQNPTNTNTYSKPNQQFSHFFHGGYHLTNSGTHGGVSSFSIRRRHKQSILSMHRHTRPEIRRIHVGIRVRFEGQILLQQ